MLCVIHPSTQSTHQPQLLDSASVLMVPSQKVKLSQRRKCLAGVNGMGPSLGLGSVGCLKMGVLYGDIGSHLKAEWVVVQLGVMDMNDHF